MNQLIIFLAKDLYLIIIAICVLFAILNPDVRKLLIIHSVIAASLVFIIDKLFDYFIYVPRPFVVEHIKPLIDQSATNSFPSGHTLTAMTAASLAFFYNKKFGIFLTILALLVGFGRVLAKAHYPIDVLGSSIIAWGIVYLCRLFVLRIFKNY